jgi:hypothetical protein
MKKLLTLSLAAALALAMLLSACSAPAEAPATTQPAQTSEATTAPAATDTASEQPTDAPATGAVEGKGTVGDYDVEILDAAAAKSYDGKSAVVVHLKWKNNSDESVSFMLAASTKVFQNGVECAITVLDAKSDIDTLAATKEVKPGAEQEVWMAYSVEDDSKIDVEVSELFTLGEGTTITKSFELK